ncbi:MAG: hypothetical protein JO314_01195, partial [Acidobacteria bacterium]|nr:hypothetical protein [Acidobacteriota bacterium]
AEQLKGVEDSGFDVTASFKEMVASFDGTKEGGRVAATADARRRAAAAREESRKHGETLAVVTENPVTARLREIQQTIEAKQYDKANSDLKQLLGQYPGEPRIYYNIGRVASLSALSITDADAQAQRLLEAKTAYSNVISTAKSDTDPALLALTYVALGRIYEFDGQNDYAIKLYDKAIQLGDAGGAGMHAAMDAKAKLIKP